MHVGLNLIYLVPGETGGTEIVARELSPSSSRRTGRALTAFLNREAAAEAGGPWKELMDCRSRCPVQGPAPVEWVRGEQLLLPRLAERARVDLVHSLANTAPAGGRFVRVVTIHDLIHRFHPETHGRVKRTGSGLLVRLAASRSDRMMADLAVHRPRPRAELKRAAAQGRRRAAGRRPGGCGRAGGRGRRAGPARLGRPAVGALAVGQAAAQEPGRLLDALALDPGR